MKCIECDLSRDLREIELHTFADLHIGDAFCDMEMIMERIAAVKENPAAFAMLNGDIINNATKGSVSDGYAEELSPMEQIDMFTRLFEPIKDKIVAVTPGNHERRTYRDDGVDITRLVCRQLGIEDKYSPTAALVFLRVGEHADTKYTEKGKPGSRQQVNYTIYCTHGSGGGRKEGAKAIRLADMASIVDADIYLHSHTHLPMIMKQSFYRTRIQNRSVVKVDKLFVNTAATLGYGGYGELGEFKPSSKAAPVIYLSGTARLAEARL